MRFTMPPTASASWPIPALLVAVVGVALTPWAMMVNPFFSGVVRIQRDRGHTAVVAGPYRAIRHPGYAGAVLFTLASPVVLGSTWAWIPALLTTAAILIRLRLEDELLHRDLQGYAAYAGRVRWRLVPVW